MLAKCGSRDKFELFDGRRVVPVQKALVHSVWNAVGYRRKLHGSTYHWDVIYESLNNHNVVTNEGLNALLNIMFHGTTQITTWYMIPFESDTTPSSSTTYATPVFTECTAYDESTRPAFVESESTAQSLSNVASKAKYTMNASKTLYGAALVGGGTAPDTKGDTAGGGVLYAASKFSSPGTFISTDIFQVYVTLTVADV